MLPILTSLNGVFEAMNKLAHKLDQLATACCILTIIVVVASHAATAQTVQDKLTPEEAVAKHLDSIGSAKAREKIKSHIILGVADGTFRLGGKGFSRGAAVLASQGTRSLIAISYGNESYPHERAGFDGRTLTVSDIRPGLRSALGKFFMTHEMPFREGLIGGTLSAAWPLLNMPARTAKLIYEGTEKVNGRKVHVLRYESQNSTGLRTRLFFDADNFRHTRTEYERAATLQMPDRPSAPQEQGAALSKLIEEFSDFKTEGGLTLPHTYKIELSTIDLDTTTLQDWVFTLTRFSFNHPIEDSQFDVRK
jgi:hypothetical protein